MKGYTDLEQSTKLAEILPLESADMWYWEFPTAPTYNDYDRPMFHKGEDIRNVPCWSLAALLSVLPQSVRLVGTPKDSYWYCECVNGNSQWYAGFESADNPVDACVEMILKLHELKLL